MKRALMLSCAALALAGCASTTVQETTSAALADAAGRIGVQAQINASEQQRQQARALVDELLARPVVAEDAVRIALVHSPATQALLAQGQAMQADAIQAGRIANPVFVFERLLRGDHKEIERLLAFNLFDLLSWPWRVQIADAQREQARLAMAATVVDTAVRARRAWIEAVSAQQALAYYGDVRIAAEASAELARRMQGAGNFSPLQRAREQAFYADAVMQQARAQHVQVAARERLVRVLGLDAAQAARLQLPPRLPDLPAQPRMPAEIAQQAFESRLDVQAARAALETTSRRQGFTGVASWVGGWHLGFRYNSESGEPVQRGYELEAPIPLFDPGDARRAGADAALLAALNRAQQVVVDAHSQLRESYHAYRSSLDIARHYRDEIVPLRNHIAEENLYRYNGMLIGVFELLADARTQVHSVIGAIDAQRDFWLADAALLAALVGQPVALGLPAASAPAAAEAAGH
jgi:outer membrane protein TolC